MIEMEFSLICCSRKYDSNGLVLDTFIDEYIIDS